MSSYPTKPRCFVEVQKFLKFGRWNYSALLVAVNADRHEMAWKVGDYADDAKISELVRDVERKIVVEKPFIEAFFGNVEGAR